MTEQSSTDMHMRIRAEEFEASKNLTMDRIFSFVGRVDPTEIRCWLSTYGNVRCLTYKCRGRYDIGLGGKVWFHQKPKFPCGHFETSSGS